MAASARDLRGRTRRLARCADPGDRRGERSRVRRRLRERASVRLHLRRRNGALRPARNHPRHHARWRRHAIPAARGKRAPRQGNHFGGAPFSAAEALAWGIVNRVCAPRVVDGRGAGHGGTHSRVGPLAVRQAKKAIHGGLQVDLRRGLDFEIEAYDRLVHSADRREGVLAFNEKRRPRFTGE